MQCFHPHTFEKLGFDVVLNWVRGQLKTEEARESLQEIQPLSDPKILLPALARVNEFKYILEFGESFPNDIFVSIGNVLDKLTVVGNWVSQSELFHLLRWLKGIASARSYFKADPDSYPEMQKLVLEPPFRQALIKEIEKVVDERGQIRDDASPELRRLRKEQMRTSSELRNTLYRVLRKANESNWSQDKEITIRNDRLVIPIKTDFKGQVSGFVQDISQSGGTVYIEPAAALPLNNRLKELQIQEQNEIVRILQELTQAISTDAPELHAFRAVMVQLEMIRAKARLALKLEAILPEVDTEKNRLDLRNAYYPLLQLKALEDKEVQPIPLSLNLNDKNRILIISGPNAGGKSVSLKTLGLLQLMLQCGFLVPVDEGSVMCLFQSLFLDIGDEQSVDTDLSTYTSRLYQWRQMGDNMNRHSLFLIDEFGSGTDPKQGGAIAESFLERFVNQKAFGIITTHYGNLKDFAEITPGVSNAAMQFDTEGLKPTYVLVMGMPGRSYAFQMARRVGVHPTILKKARKKVGVDELETDAMLRELERKNMRYSRLLKENERREQKLKGLLEKTEREKERLQRERKQIIREAKLEAKTLIEKANRRIENTIREIKEKNAAKKATQKLREKLRASIPEVEPVPEEKAVPSQKEKGGPQILSGTPQPGDWVKLKSSDSFGRFIELKGKKAVVEVGAIRMNVPLSQLQKIKAPAPNKKDRVQVSLLGGTAHRRIKTELDVMGKRVEDALPEVDRFLDQARLAGLGRVRILHGKGSGILREAIRKHMMDLSFVKKATDAPIEEGGAGWTIVELR
jgi:DNA mismatch repair protein MutS2